MLPGFLPMSYFRRAGQAVVLDSAWCVDRSGVQPLRFYQIHRDAGNREITTSIGPFSAEGSMRRGSWNGSGYAAPTLDRNSILSSFWNGRP
jgi:hypothetical protein